MTTSVVRIDTILCLECGTNTQRLGFVNRIPSSRDGIDGYICGTCSSAWEQDHYYKGKKLVYCEFEDIDDNFDWEKSETDYDREAGCEEAEEALVKNWYPEVDEKFPFAPDFRKLMQSRGYGVSDFTEADAKQIQKWESQ